MLVYLNQSIPFIRTIFHLYILYESSLIKGLILIWAFYKIYDFTILKLFNLERISTGDFTFMWNTPEQTYNIIIALTLDKMDKDGIKNLLIEKGIKQFRKFRSKLNYKFFDWWWQEVPLEECLKRIEVVESNESNGIKNKEDLLKWAYLELTEKFDIKNELPYKFIIIENVETDGEYKNILIMKVDHCLTDGVSFMNFICGLSDNYSQKLFPNTMSRKINRIYKFLADVLFPFYFLLVVYRTMIVFKRVETPFKCNKPVTGIPYIALSDKINLQEYIKINKKLNVTFNDLMTSVISSAIKKYMASLKMKVPPHVLLCFPINMKPLPKDINDITITNNSAGAACEIDLIDDVASGCKLIHKRLGSVIRNYNYARATQILAERLFQHLPFYIARKIIMNFYNDYDITFSNVPGPREELYYSNCKVLDIIPLFTPGFIHSFLGIISYGTTFKFVVIHDSAVDYKPDNFLSFIMEEMKIIKLKVDYLNEEELKDTIGEKKIK